MENHLEDKYINNYRRVQILRRTKLCQIELLEHIFDDTRLIRRTYPDDKREIFNLLQRADSPFLSEIKAVCFHVDTIVYEEYIEGEILSDYLVSQKITPKQAERFLRELLSAVSAIHKLNIIHRDIKPENILIDKHSHIHLIDFGIARIYRPNEVKDTELLGTVGYASPEQFGFSQSDFRTDIYAIGMTCRDIDQLCSTRHLFRKIMKKCSRLDPMQRYPDIDSIQAEFKKRCMFRWGSLLLIALLSIGIYALLLCPKEISNPAGEQPLIKEKQPSITENPIDEEKSSEEDETGNALFTGHGQTAQAIRLHENEKEQISVEFNGLDRDIEVEAELTSQGLDLQISASGIRSHFHLANQYEIPSSYEDTSLYAEVLFYDLDHDGKDEIWVAISDRMVYQMANGMQGMNQNYMVGFGLYCDEEGHFSQMDTQLITEGDLELDTTVPHGIWQSAEMEGYLLEDNRLTYLQW